MIVGSKATTRHVYRPQYCSAISSRRTLIASAAGSVLTGLVANGAGAGERSLTVRPATPSASPASTRYASVQDFVETIIAVGQAPGAVWLVSHRGEVEFGTAGVMDLDTGIPMRRDSIVRIASVTKPIVAMAVMTLVEQGEIGLDDPVDPWLPELADRQVVRTLESPLDDTVPSDRPITVRDVLSFKMGLGYFFDPPGTYPIQEAFAEAGIASMEQFPPVIPPSDEYMGMLGSLPLASQPGEVWRYNTPMDVAGVLIERITGSSLEDYLQAAIFALLGMDDTGFWVPEAKIDRLATLYGRNPDSGDLGVRDQAVGGAWSEPPVFESGAAGLASTVDDLLAFGRVLLHGSRHDSGQLLSDALFAEMVTDTLTPDQKAAATFYPGFWNFYGWGLGVGIFTAEDAAPSAGSVGWLGGTSTALFSVPAEDLIGVLLLQVDDPTWFGPVNSAFWGNVYSEIAQ